MAVAAAVCAANIVSTAQRVAPRGEGPPTPADAAERQDRRFDAMRRALGARGITGTVSYLGGFPTGRAAGGQAVEDYYLAQFSLAPVVLDPDTAPHPWAVADMRGDAAKGPPPAGWRQVEDTGDGVLLLRRTGP